MLEIGSDEPSAFFQFIRGPFIRKMRKFFDQHGLDFHYLYVFENPGVYGKEKEKVGAASKWHVHFLIHVPTRYSSRFKERVRSLVSNRTSSSKAINIRTYYNSQARSYGPIYLLKGIGRKMPKEFFQIVKDGTVHQIKKIKQGIVTGKRFGISRSLTPNALSNRLILQQYHLLPQKLPIPDEAAMAWLLKHAQMHN